MANILIADSDPAIRRILSQALDGSGHAVYEAEDGDAALASVDPNHIQIVLADKDLPGKDGLEVLREIKRTRFQIPVILMLGIADDAEEMLEAGADQAVAKPFNLEDVRRAVAEAAEKAARAPKPAPSPAPVREEKPRRRKWWVAAGLALALAGGGAGWIFFRARAGAVPTRLYAVPYAHLSGIAFQGESVWTCDWYSQSFYRHTRDTILSLKQTAGQEGWHPTGVAWDGKQLWSVSNWERQIARHASDDQLTIQERLDCPIDPVALFFDGESFWTCDARQPKLYKLKLEAGRVEILKTATSPGRKPVGICRQGDFLWSADGETGLIYKHRLPDFKVLEAYEPPAEIHKDKLSCFTGDGKSFWIGSDDARRIHQLDLRSLRLVSAE